MHIYLCPACFLHHPAQNPPLKGCTAHCGWGLSIATSSQDHLSSTGMPTGQPGLNGPSLRFFSWMISGCVKLSIKSLQTPADNPLHTDLILQCAQFPRHATSASGQSPGAIMFFCLSHLSPEAPACNRNMNGHSVMITARTKETHIACNIPASPAPPPLGAQSNPITKQGNTA